MSETLVSISYNELCQLDGIESDIIINIVEYGIVAPVSGDDIDQWVFDTTSIHWIKKASRIHRDLEIDWVAVALVVNLMQANEDLMQENQRYQRQLKRFIEY